MEKIKIFDIVFIFYILYNCVEVVGLRMTRFETNRRKRAFKRTILVLFIFVIPLAAIAASMFLMNIYNGSGKEAAAELSPSNNMTAFKYDYIIEGKTLYRIELKDTESFEEAEAYIKVIKGKKLNGFIVKENGYKVVYGVFANKEDAVKVQQSIAAKVESVIAEFKLQGYSLKYNEADNAFIQLVQATDKLIWDNAAAKSMVSLEVALKSKNNLEAVFEGISQGEIKLEKYLGYAEKINVPNEQKLFRESFVVLLEEVLAHKLDNTKDYYKIQESMMNQLEAYKKFIGKLSI